MVAAARLEQPAGFDFGPARGLERSEPDSQEPEYQVQTVWIALEQLVARLHVAAEVHLAAAVGWQQHSERPGLHFEPSGRQVQVERSQRQADFHTATLPDLGLSPDRFDRD